MRMEPLSLHQLWIVIFVTLCITRSFHGIVGANGDGTGVRSNDDYQSKNSPGASMDNKKAGKTSESTSSSKEQGGHHHRFNSLVHNSTLMFDWRASDWSECKYRDSSSCCDCYKHRNISCVFRETGEQIPPFYCRKVLPVTPHNEEKCSPCQQPCVMSLWSPWSECSATCSPAIRHRTRAVGPSPLHLPWPDTNHKEAISFSPFLSSLARGVAEGGGAIKESKTGKEGGGTPSFFQSYNHTWYNCVKEHAGLPISCFWFVYKIPRTFSHLPILLSCHTFNGFFLFPSLFKNIILESPIGSVINSP